MSKSIVKSSNLLLKIEFSRFCHSEFVHDTGSVSEKPLPILNHS